MLPMLNYDSKYIKRIYFTLNIFKYNFRSIFILVFYFVHFKELPLLSRSIIFISLDSSPKAKALFSYF